MMYWDSINGTKFWQEHCATVKKTFPKPV
jgi:hypothetical protein